MIIEMKKNAAEEDIETIINKIKKEGFEHVTIKGQEKTVIGVKGNLKGIPNELFYGPSIENIIRISREYKLVSKEFKEEDTVVEVGKIKIGGKYPPVFIAGPCAIESREQIIETAKAVKDAGAHILRGGAYKPRRNPYEYQGYGEEALKHLKEAGELVDLPVESEATGESIVDLVDKYCSIIHIGARNSKSFELLKKVGKTAKKSNKPVLLKRGEEATIKEFLGAAEYVANEGCENIILCLRGIRSYETLENGFRRYTADIDSIPVIKQESHLPVIFDPSHSSGNRNYVRAFCRAAIGAGADGLMIETHLNPDYAKCDGPQQITPKTLSDIIKESNVVYRIFFEKD